jgi:CHRD domain
MKTLRIALAGLIAVSAATIGTHVTAGASDHRDRNDRVRATLVGRQEVPVVSTVARGRFDAKIADDESSLEWTLTYSGLQGTVTQSHIHIGQKNVKGGIVIWLCQTAAAPAPAAAGMVAMCPQSATGPTTLSGTVTSANVVAVPAQQFGGDLGEVIDAIRAGFGYANVHTNPSTGGEIRGQLRTDDDDDDDHDR